jgi:hypothetical protein
MISEQEVLNLNPDKHDLLNKITAYYYPKFTLNKAARERKC